MLIGRFGTTTGRPYLDGYLWLPRLGILDDVSFIVDTGADTTLLMPTDASKLGINYRLLTGVEESIGIGGATVSFVEPALLGFREDSRHLHVYSLPLEICSPSPDVMNVPSLLGRDILDRWRMVYSPATSELTFQVLSADYTDTL